MTVIDNPVTGIGELWAEGGRQPLPQIRLEPNPFRGRVEITVLRGKDAQAVVYGMNGIMVKQLEMMNGKGAWDGRDRAGLRVKSGIYFVRVWSGDEVVVKRVVVY